MSLRIERGDEQRIGIRQRQVGDRLGRKAEQPLSELLRILNEDAGELPRCGGVELCKLGGSTVGVVTVRSSQ